MLQETTVHEDAIQDMQMSPDETYVITASLDKTAKLVDVETFEPLKTYKTGRFVQSAAISPLFDHVRPGALGQDVFRAARCKGGRKGAARDHEVLGCCMLCH